MRAAAFIVAMIGIATAAHAQGPSPQDAADEGWPPVPPLSDQSAVGNYCIHRNLVYSMGDVICVGLEGLVCVPPAGPGTGGRAYWSPVPVSRGEINWAPPAHCDK
jgi:hypothetical protein